METSRQRCLAAPREGQGRHSRLSPGRKTSLGLALAPSSISSSLWILIPIQVLKQTMQRRPLRVTRCDGGFGAELRFLRQAQDPFPTCATKGRGGHRKSGENPPEEWTRAFACLLFVLQQPVSLTAF